jgi:hypothetical protein
MSGLAAAAGFFDFPVLDCGNRKRSLQASLVYDATIGDKCRLDTALAAFPKSRRGETCTCRQGFELCPDEVRMNAPTQSAIGAGHDILAPDESRKALNALGHEFRMLDNAGGMAHHAGDEDLACG